MQVLVLSHKTLWNLLLCSPLLVNDVLKFNSVSGGGGVGAFTLGRCVQVAVKWILQMKKFCELNKFYMIETDKRNVRKRC